MLLAGLGILLVLLVATKKKTTTNTTELFPIDPSIANTPAVVESAQQNEIRKWSLLSSTIGLAATAGFAATSAFTLASAGPIGAAIAAAIVAIALLRGTTHLVANEWVQKVQNPFATALSAIVDAKDESIKNGSATKASISLAWDSVNGLWNQYRTVADRWKQQGPDYKTVIDQSYETLDYRYADGKRYGTGLITRILADMDNQINQLPN